MNKIITALITHLCSAMVGGLVCFVYFDLSCASPRNFHLRENGVGWFWFGQGVISSCNCVSAEVFLGDIGKPTRITDPNKIAEIKKWIVDNKFDRQWRYSPMWPRDVGCAVIENYSLILSASTDYNSVDSVIVGIPLEPLPMGLIQAEWSGKIAELKKLLDTK